MAKIEKQETESKNFSLEEKIALLRKDIMYHVAGVGTRYKVQDWMVYEIGDNKLLLYAESTYRKEERPDGVLIAPNGQVWCKSVDDNDWESEFLLTHEQYQTLQEIFDGIKEPSWERTVALLDGRGVFDWGGRSVFFKLKDKFEAERQKESRKVIVSIAIMLVVGFAVLFFAYS